MSKGSSYLRGLSIVLNFLLGICGVSLLLFGIIANSTKYHLIEDGSHVVLVSVGLGLSTILLAVLGVYGAYQEQLLALLLYNIFMAIEFIILLTLAIITILAQTQVEKEIEQSFGQILPLSDRDEGFKHELSKLQIEAECCGLKNYFDWGNHFHDSCYCPAEYPKKKVRCVAVQNKNQSMTNDSKAHNVTMYVYSTPCGPVLITYVKNAIRILLGILFTLATIKVAAMIVAFFLWNKIRTRLQDSDAQDKNRRKYELQPENRM